MDQHSFEIVLPCGISLAMMHRGSISIVCAWMVCHTDRLSRTFEVHVLHILRTSALSRLTTGKSVQAVLRDSHTVCANPRRSIASEVCSTLRTSRCVLVLVLVRYSSRTSLFASVPEVSIMYSTSLTFSRGASQTKSTMFCDNHLLAQ